MLFALAASVPLATSVANQPTYVALGSSYAAGVGLGERVEATPPVCMRGTASYPNELAQKMHLLLSDASCSGSTVSDILQPSQAHQPAQISAVYATAKLVTVTAGGNDVSYIGDMMRVTGAFGPKLETPAAVKDRPFDQLGREMVATLYEIKRRAPHAVIVMTTYPAVLPEKGACASLGLSEAQADVFRQVAERLASVTREAASKVDGVVVVDMAKLSRGHDACSTQPWTTGAKPKTGFAFHPNEQGAAATAKAIEDMIKSRSLM